MVNGFRIRSSSPAAVYPKPASLQEAPGLPANVGGFRWSGRQGRDGVGEREGRRADARGAGGGDRRQLAGVLGVLRAAEPGGNLAGAGRGGGGVVRAAEPALQPGNRD